MISYSTDYLQTLGKQLADSLSVRFGRAELLRAIGLQADPLPFRQWAAHYLPHYFTTAPSRFHEWFAEQLASPERGKRRNVLAPRGAAKSTWINAYVLYCAIHKTEPYIILTSDTGGQAAKYLESISDELTTNAMLLADYPNATGRGRVWRADALETRNGVRIESLGTGTKIRGRKFREHRPTLVVVDDPQNSNHIVSELQRERSLTWLFKDVSNAGQPDTNIVVAGTALHEDCIVCKLQRTPNWESRVWKSMEEWPTRMDLWADWESILQHWEDPDRDAKAMAFYQKHKTAMDAGAQVLWPERFPLYDLMLKRASDGEAAFLYEHQNEPTDPSMAEWPPSVFSHGAFWFDQWPAQLQMRTLFLDPSKGSSDRQGDYSAFILYGRDAAGIEYVEADLKRRPVDQIVADGVEHVVKFKPDGFGVESNTFQELLAPLFRAEAARRRIGLPLYLINNSTNKQVRIRRLTEPLTQRKMRFRRGSPGTQMLVDQLRKFPNGDHDDGPDALEGARRLSIRLTAKRNEKPKGKR